MEFFKNHPFVRLIVPILLGILIQFYLPQSQHLIFWGGSFFVLSFIIISRFWLSYAWHYLKGILLFGALMAIAMFLTLRVLETDKQSQSNTDETWFLGTLLDIPLEKEKIYRSQVEVLGQKAGDSWKNEQARIWVYFEKDSLVGHLQAGQKLVFKAKISERVMAKNPFGFDFEKYLTLKQIDYTLYVKSGHWMLLSEQVSGLKQRALNVRARLIAIYESVGIAGDELAVLSALTLGYKSKMDAGIRDAYAGAGASHILAVSGMHVGILYSVFMFLFSWLKLFKKYRKLRFIFIALLLWVYAFITGLSPSVCRASTMFTFILLGLILNKRVNIYNSLAASAFLLLLINPLLLFDIGFQLSYVAVAGIVFFQPRIYRLFYFKYRWIDWLWGLTSVSVAAQLVTSPITLYHFHQFPVYFWLSNMVVIAGATILLYGALLMLALVKIPLLISALGWVLKNTVFVMNGFIAWVNSLPMAVLTDIPMQKEMVWLMYLVLLTITAWLLSQKYRYLIGALLLLLLWAVSFTVQKLEHKNHQLVCVYQLSNQSAIQFVSGNSSWWFLSDSVYHPKIKPLVQNANLFWKTKQNQYFLIKNTDTLIHSDAFFYHRGFWKLAEQKGFLLGDKSLHLMQLTDSLNLDYLLVTGNPLLKPELLPEKMKIGKLIVDGSVPVWQQNDWVPVKTNQWVYFTAKQGAFLSP